MALNLCYIAFTKHLCVFDQLVANLGRSSTEDKSILMFSELRLQGTYLQIHFALVS